MTDMDFQMLQISQIMLTQKRDRKYYMVQGLSYFIPGDFAQQTILGSLVKFHSNIQFLRRKSTGKKKTNQLDRHKQNSFFSSPQLKNATFWLDEMVQNWFLQIH